MADRIITAEALITARDGTGDVFSKIASKFQQLGKGAKVSADLEKMAQTLQRSQSQLRALEKTQSARLKFTDARAQFNAQKVAVEAAAKALSNATKPTKELESAYRRAQAAVSKASAEFEKQKTAMLEAKRAAEGFGTPLSKIASEQAKLKTVIESTTRAIEKQGAAELKAAELAAKASIAAERAQERRAHGIAHHGIVNYALGAAAMGVSAHGIMHVIDSSIESGAELQHERVASANAGRKPEEIRAFEEAAKRTALSVPTASYTESMKTLLETTSAFGSTQHAMEHLTFMMRTAAVLKAASGGKIDESAGEMGQQFARFFEMRGVAGDARRFEHEGNEMVRAMAFSGGTFNPREMFHFAQQAKSALRNYDLDYMSRIAPSIVGEVGGDRAGTGANAFNSVILGKARDRKQAAQWMKYGLLDPKQVDMKNGAVVSWSAGAVRGTDLAMSNPLRWFEEVALPAMKAKGVKVDDAGELTKALNQMFRNSMSNMFANENAQLADRNRLAKDRKLIDATEHPEDMYKRNLSEDPLQAVEALKASFDSLEAAVTSPAMLKAAGAITNISFALAKLSAAAMDHPIAAMSAGALAGAGALSGAGYLSYQIMNGFGLGTSAAALDGSAAALTEAAAKLGLAGSVGKVGGAGGTLPGSEPNVALKGDKPGGGPEAGKIGPALEPGGTVEPIEPPVKAGRFFGAAAGRGLFAGGVASLIEYELYQNAVQAIDSALEAGPHPSYPRGYDPYKKLNEGPISLLKDILSELPHSSAGEPPPIGRFRWGRDPDKTPLHLDAAKDPHRSDPTPPILRTQRPHPAQVNPQHGMPHEQSGSHQGRPPESSLPGLDSDPDTTPWHNLARALHRTLRRPALPTFAHPWLTESPHPSLAPISDHAGGLPTFSGGGSRGPIEATIKPGQITADLKGQATVSVTVKVDGPGTVVNQSSSSSGNIKASSGASMPGAKSAAGSGVH